MYKYNGQHYDYLLMLYIPTYNRVKEVSFLLEYLQKKILNEGGGLGNLSEKVIVVVSDNSEKVLQDKLNLAIKKLKINCLHIKNSVNKGYDGNFLNGYTIFFKKNYALAFYAMADRYLWSLNLEEIVSALSGAITRSDLPEIFTFSSLISFSNSRFNKTAKDFSEAVSYDYLKKYDNLVASREENSWLVTKANYLQKYVHQGYINTCSDLGVTQSLRENFNLLELTSYDRTYMCSVAAQLYAYQLTQDKGGNVLIFKDSYLGRVHSVTENQNKITQHNYNSVIIGNYLLSYLIPVLSIDKSDIRRLSENIYLSSIFPEKLSKQSQYSTEIFPPICYLPGIRNFGLKELILVLMWKFQKSSKNYYIKYLVYIFTKILFRINRNSISNIIISKTNENVEKPIDNNKKICIFLTTFNRQVYLKRNLENLISIIKSNNLEYCYKINIIDNGSTDATSRIAANFIKLNPEIDIKLTINRVNLGVGGGVVPGILSDNSEYLMFLGDDDYLSPTYLVKIYNLISAGRKIIAKPSIHGVHNSRKLGFGSMLENGDTKLGIFEAYKIIVESHQLSGLIIPRSKGLEDLLKCYRGFTDHIYVAMAAVSIGGCESIIVGDSPVLVFNNKNKEWKHNIRQSFLQNGLALLLTLNIQNGNQVFFYSAFAFAESINLKTILMIKSLIKIALEKLGRKNFYKHFLLYITLILSSILIYLFRIVVVNNINILFKLINPSRGLINKTAVILDDDFYAPIISGVSNAEYNES